MPKKNYWTHKTRFRKGVAYHTTTIVMNGNVAMQFLEALGRATQQEADAKAASTETSNAAPSGPIARPEDQK